MPIRRVNKYWEREWNRFIREADDRTRQACADALNEASDRLIAKIKSNMNAQGIKEKSGKLRASIKCNKATVKTPNIVIVSEVYAPLPKSELRWRNYRNSLRAPDRHWKRTPVRRPTRRYPPEGVPYGRIIEFSTRINKPFFYKAWYEMRSSIKARFVSKLEKAWSGN